MSSASTQPVGSGSAPLSMELETSAEHPAATAAATFPGSNTSYSEAIDKQASMRIAGVSGCREFTRHGNAK